MRREVRWLFPIGLAAAAAASAALDLREFAVGWPIELPEQGGVFFDVPLTLDVYRHASSMNDLAILDAAGEPMPFYRVTSPPPPATEQRVVLEASPLYATGNGAERVAVSAGGGETRVSVASPADGASPAITGFALDARAVERAPLALELEWRQGVQPFLLGVRVEQSANLTDWRTVGGASVAALAVGSAEVRHARVPVAAAPGGYYRITPDRGVPGFHLERAALVFADAPPPDLRRVKIAALGADAPGAAGGPAAPMYFDAGGPVPARTAALEFASGRGWVRADVAVSDSLDGPWTTIGYDVLFYELDQNGETLASAPLPVGRHEARYWRVTPEQAVALARVTLALEYPEEHLRFSADGEAPYLLAAGTLAQGAGPDSTFAAVWSERRLAASVARASLGARVELGGRAALEAPFPWRTAGLWAVLVAGALAVVGMAVRLAREMTNKAA